MKAPIIAFSALTLSVLFPGCSNRIEPYGPQMPASGPDVISFVQPGLSPKGLAYDPGRNHFLVSSIAEGSIYQVHLDGAVQPFIVDDALTSTLGLK